jgi:hypothetical protein
MDRTRPGLSAIARRAAAEGARQGHEPGERVVKGSGRLTRHVKGSVKGSGRLNRHLGEREVFSRSFRACPP